MPISNNQDAGQKAWELERQELIRRLAESEKENKGLKRRLESNESKLEAKDTKIKSLKTDKKQLRDMYGKRLKRADGGRMMLENGKMGPLMTVQLRSIPTRKEKQARREAGGDSHKPYSRDYCPVLEKVVQAVDGPTQVRKGVGGWGFRLTDKLLHYDFLRRASQASGASIGEAVENTMIGKSRTGLLRVLARPLGGAQSRHKLDERRVDRLRVFQRPSPKVMRERVNPAMILALLRTARTKAEEATRIMVHFDATDFARYHVMGILLSFVFCVRQHTDPFGNVTYSVLIQRMPLHLQQTVNKLAKKVKMGATGAFWSPEAPRALCDAAALAGLTGLFTENELVSKLSSVTDAARDNVGLSKEKHPDTDAMCGENSPIHAIFFTGDALWNSCKRLEQAGMTRHLSQFYRGEKLPDLTQELRRRRLALRRQQDLEKRQASGDTEVSVGADVAEVATLTDQVPAPEENAGDAAMPVAAAEAAAAGPGPAASEAEVSTSRSSFCALPPEPRLPPPAIERSGPVFRCREKTSKLRSYAEGKLRAFFPGLLAMRWAFGFWRVKSVRAGLSKEERWRIHSERPRSPERLERFITKMAKWILERHLKWCKDTLGGEIEDVEVEKVFSDGQIEHLVFIVPVLTDKELAGGRLSVFCSRRPVRSRTMKGFEEVPFLWYPQEALRSSRFNLLLRKLPDRLVSMASNPLRYYPGRDQRVVSKEGAEDILRIIANAYSCFFHGIHNSSKRPFLYLNGGFASQLISVANTLSSKYVRPFIEDALRHLFDKRQNGIDCKTDFYVRFRHLLEDQARQGKGVTLEQAVIESGHDWNKGLPECITARDNRWGTLHVVAVFFQSDRRFLQFGIGRRFGHAYHEADELAALVAIFSYRGFDPDDHPRFRIEDHVKLSWGMLAYSSNRAQLAIVCGLNSLFLQPLFAAGSANKGCGASAMMGLNSAIRNLLLIWSRTCLVDTSRNSKGWQRWIALGHRTDGSKFGRALQSLRALNPNCGPKVNRLLGPFGNKHTEKAIRDIVSEFRQIAMMHGPALPTDLRIAYDAAYRKRNPRLYDENEDRIVSKSFAVKMSQLQWHFGVIAENVTQTIRSDFEFYIYGLEGFVAGLGKQLSTPSVPCMDRNDSHVYDQTFTYADPWAMANGVILWILGEELLETLEPQLKGRDLLDFFPMIVGVFAKQGKEQLRDLLGLVPEKWGQRFDRLEDASVVVFNQETGDRQYHVHDRTLFPRTVSRSDGRFKVLDDCCKWAVTTITDSKSMEQWFSPVSQQMRTKGNSKILQIIAYFFREAWEAAGESPLDVSFETYFAAEELALLPEWTELLSVDSMKRELMRKDEQRENMPEYIKHGGDWKQTNTKTEGRTNKFADPLDPKSKSDVVKTLNRLVGNICARVGETRDITRDLAKQLRRRSKAASAADAVQGFSDQAPKTRAHKRKVRGGVVGEVGSAEINNEAASESHNDDNHDDSIEGGVAAEMSQDNEGDVDSPEINCEASEGQNDESIVDEIDESQGRETAGDVGLNAEKPIDEDDMPLNMLRDLNSARQNARGGQAGGLANADEGVRDVEPESIVTIPCSNDCVDSEHLVPMAGSDCLHSVAAECGLELNGSHAEHAADAKNDLSKSQRNYNGGDAVSDVPLVPVPGSSVSHPRMPQPASNEKQSENSSAEPGPLPSPLRTEDPLLYRLPGGSDSMPETNSESRSAHSRRGDWGEDVDTNIWSYKFVQDVAEQRGSNDWGYKSDVWLKSELEFTKEPWGDEFKDCVTVTRRFKKSKGLEIDPISFKVETTKNEELNSKYFFIMFDQYASRCIVDIFKISEPVKTRGRISYERTMKFRRVWTAEEASTRADYMENTQNGLLGTRALKQIAQSNFTSRQETYHVGDVAYEGDLRSLIGVIKWYPDVYQSARELQAGYFPLYPRADSIRVGGHFSQKPSC